MFDLFVLICLASKPDICVTLEDTSNPYATHETCIVRAYNVKQDLPIHFPEYMFDTYECSDNESGKIFI